MKNEILKILLKPRSARNIYENILVRDFWRTCSNQEFKYAYQISELYK